MRAPIVLLLLATTAAGAFALGRSKALRLPSQQHRQAEDLGGNLNDAPLNVQRCTIQVLALSEQLERVHADLLNEMRLGKERVAAAAEFPTQAPPLPTVENEKAQERANQLLDRAAQTRSWTEVDKKEFETVLQHMDASSRDEAIARLYKKVNAQEIVPAFAGPL